MLHLVDAYLEDDNNSSVVNRVKEYRKAFKLFLESESNEILDNDDVAFSCEFVTNPDNMMNRWNKIAPALTPKRAISQACTIIMMGEKC